MIILNPAGLALIFLWTITASANPQLRPVFRAAAAYNGLSSDQRKCAVDETYSAVYKSACKDKDCFCASPQFMSDTADACLLFYSDFLTPRPEVYSTENYNGIMMFFGNECGTFEVQTKSVATQSITYTAQLVQTKTQLPGPATTPTGAASSPTDAADSGSSNSGTGSNTQNTQGGDQTQKSGGGGGLSIGATAQVQHIYKALQMVNARLTDANAITEENIGVVLILSLYERYDNQYDRGLVHLDGLRRMIEMRGGIGNWIKSSPETTRKMFR
ncbi:hypothetical protein N0V88_000641 [Collariella sp. IMI 366227]|nr:hypothetical protein N0V88_000641 [Collariella sp. IMI 366227]